MSSGARTSRGTDAGSGRRKTVALVGLPGTGKTTVGRVLQREFGWSWADLDVEIEHRAGTSVASIIRVEGEQRFRDLERAALLEQLDCGLDVLSLGGGALIREDNREELLHRALIVHLEANLDELAARVVEEEEEALRSGSELRRPLLNRGGETSLVERVRARLAELAERRKGLYEIAHVSIRTRGLSPVEIAALVVKEREKQLLVP